MKKRILLCLIVSVFLASFVLLPETGLTLNEGSLIEREGFTDEKYAPWDLYVEPHAKAKAEVVTWKNKADITEAAVCITVDHPGYNTWDIQFRHRGIPVVKGQTYNYSFKIMSDKNVNVRAQLAKADVDLVNGGDYKTFISQPMKLVANQSVEFNASKKINSDYPQAEWSFHLSCKDMVNRVKKNYDDREQYKIYIYWICLSNSQHKRPAAPGAISAIRVNPDGYTPDGKKIALLVSSSTGSKRWSLNMDRVGEIASGYTQYKGRDRNSGDYLHVIDFSSYNEYVNGDSVYLEVGSVKSPKFSIKWDNYKLLMFDALKFFYHQRSSLNLESPYLKTGQNSYSLGWIRDAGHVGDSAIAVKADYAKAFLSKASDYTIPAKSPIVVNKGWYDAGDHGKYVVNGGLAVWLLQNQFERMKINNGHLLNIFKDGYLEIPESGNGVPDILDEARWEMEMLLAMQVPQGDPKAGMAYHKLHDNKWTEMPKTPAEATLQSQSYTEDPDDYRRVFYPPTTAATLNLAAVAAQSARLWKSYDSSFAKKCLTAAEKAWQAAIKYPNITTRPIELPDVQHPSKRMVLRPDLGGGFYEDDKVGDEFYWAACELYLSTSNNTIKQQCMNYITNTGYFCKIKGMPVNGGELEGPFDWRDTESLGTISLAIVPGSPYQYQARNSINSYANEVFEILNNGSQIYPAPLTNFYWGSNSAILNRVMILAYAYDFTKNSNYLNAVGRSMDYLMGVNAIGYSFITNYGTTITNNRLNIHHRFFAKQYNKTCPYAPPGILVGGPNQTVSDWDNLMLGCAFPQTTKMIDGKSVKVAKYPAKAYYNHIGSYASNEVTINWNAILAWVAAFAHENLGDVEPPSTPYSIWYTGKTSTSVTLGWNASTDNCRLKHYKLTYGSKTIYSTKNSYTVSGLSRGRTYTFSVKAVDYSGNESAGSNSLRVTTN